jgi:hypothetical protein
MVSTSTRYSDMLLTYVAMFHLNYINPDRSYKGLHGKHDVCGG